MLFLLAVSVAGNAATVRDDFTTQLYSNNDGTVTWNGDWVEIDGQGGGPTGGNVFIDSATNELSLDDQPNTGGQPSATREANLAGAAIAVWSFDWRTTAGVDLSDAIVAEVSANGGGTWTILETFTGLNGINSGSRNYDIAAFVSANTQVRFRVTNLYGGGNEDFLLDFVEIAFALTGTDLSVTQADTPDPVNVVNPLSYTLTVSNNGPDDATGVTVTDTLPAGTTFQSASATQGSCSEAAGIVTCTLGDMISGATATINIALTAPVSVGTITNTATVTGNETDPISGNDTSNENTTVQNLNVNQLCYLVADAGGGGGGNDLFTMIDTADFDPVTNETNIGIGTGTNTIEAIAYNSATGVVYAANGGRLGTLNTTTGVFQGLPQTFGTGTGSLGAVTFSDVDGLTYDATPGVMFGSHARGGGGVDVLIQINMATGAHIPNAFGAGVDYVQIQPQFGNTLVDDIAVDPTTGIMYASTNNGGSTDRLVTVNKATGATAHIALITVPDIEGMGTDPTGQLWGTSGTQGILYEIDKFTGVGSNGRTINNGGDYESVDCYAISPTVTADLGLSKIVNDATPREGDTITYTVTVQNTGPGPATVVQIMDLLPGGVTFVSATATQGTYDPPSGDWFVGTIGAGSTETLTLQADVDAGTGGTTITNTATVDFLSQIDPNVANDVASVDIIPIGAPSLLVLKAAAVVEDPFNGTTNPKSIPGATLRYLVMTTNTGTGPVDTDTLVITDPIPANMALRVIDFDGVTSGPVQFVDGTPASGLIYTFVALGDAGDDVSFSNDGGTSFTYSPTADANGVDFTVTHIRINTKGDFLGNSGGGDPNFDVYFKAVVQ